MSNLHHQHDRPQRDYRTAIVVGWCVLLMASAVFLIWALRHQRELELRDQEIERLTWAAEQMRAERDEWGERIREAGE